MSSQVIQRILGRSGSAARVLTESLADRLDAIDHLFVQHAHVAVRLLVELAHLPARRVIELVHLQTRLLAEISRLLARLVVEQAADDDEVRLLHQRVEVDPARPEVAELDRIDVGVGGEELQVEGPREAELPVAFGKLMSVVARNLASGERRVVTAAAKSGEAASLGIDGSAGFRQPPEEEGRYEFFRVLDESGRLLFEDRFDGDDQLRWWHLEELCRQR